MIAATLDRSPVTTIAGALERLGRGLMVEPMSLTDYVREAWPIIEPARKFSSNWHIDYICEHLAAVDDGQINRLVINIPPRSMKSILVSVLWPTWSWSERPWTRWIFASYAASLSVKHSVDRRDVIQSDWYKSRWGTLFELSEDQNVKAEFKNTERGTMIATSVGGTITGKGGDRIVIDDLLNPLEAESKTSRDAANTFYSNTLVTRLDDPRSGVIVIVMQRLHKDDLTGRVLQEGGWTHIKIPGKSVSQEKLIFPMSGRVHLRQVDELLHPERSGEKEWEGQRRAMGTRTHDAQVQQNPTSETGNILKRSWWKFYSKLPDVFDSQIQSWDMTFKETKDGSYVVGQVWGLRGADKFLLDQVRDRMDFPTSKRALITLSEKWPRAIAKIVEDKANGAAIIDDLRRTIQGLIAVSPHGDKTSRANAMAPTIEAGNVYLPLPENASWIQGFIDECAEFPSGDNDDQVDAASQAIIRLNEMSLMLPGIKANESIGSGHGAEVSMEDGDEDAFENNSPGVFDYD